MVMLVYISGVKCRSPELKKSFLILCIFSSQLILISADVNDGYDVTTAEYRSTEAFLKAEHIQNIEYRKVAISTEQCDYGRAKNSFSWADYLVLSAMLVISCGIGIFYGFIGDKQTTTSDFLLGGSSMGTIPMAMSLAASFITAIELLGNPAEMYVHGSQYWMVCLSFLLVVPLTSKLYLPVFMKLRLTSCYEYLALRFSPRTRLFASVLYILQMVLYTSVAVYAPALALSHVTGLNVYLAVTVVYVVCIFYASQGGMKAVIMADTFQAAVLIGSLFLIMHLGEKFVDEPEAIWTQNFITHRLQLFNLNPDPTIRNSFWSVVLGGTFYWMTMFCSNQASIQKYLSVSNISQVRKALWVSCIGLILIFTINFYTGMIMVAHYRTCDPLKANEIGASDELLPLYVTQVMGHLKGITGFFVAGIFAASLGTVASALNSLAAVTCQDLITGVLGVAMPESKGALWAKWISIGYGALSFLLVFVVEQLGSVMQVAISFNGMVGGVTLGLFSLGMFFPWANSRGAIFGATIGMALMIWMGIGQQVAMATGSIKIREKATSIEDCPCVNSTSEKIVKYALDSAEEHSVFFLYRISFLWYSAIGFLVTIIIGLAASFATGKQDPREVDSDLISPPVYELLHSLPNNIKDVLCIPLKVSFHKDNGIQLKGIVNVTLDLTDENPPIRDEEYIRKISVMTA